MFCKKDEQFLSPDQYWNTTDPDFSECFQKSVLLWIPCTFLVLLAPVRLIVLNLKNQKYVIPWSWQSRTKLALAFVIAVLGALDIGCSLYEHFHAVDVPVVNFLASLILILTIVVYAIVVYFERKHGICSSGFLFIFWFLLNFVSIVTFRSKIRVLILQGKVENAFQFVTFYIFFAVIMVQFIICCFVDKKPIGAMPLEDKKPCPERYASYLSQITFWWFTSMVVQGFKRALVHTDLWNLNSSNKSKNVMPAFERHLQKELNRCKRLHEGTDQPGKPSSTADVHTDEVELEELNNKESPDVKILQHACAKKEVRLFLAMAKTFWLKSLIGAMFKLVHDILQFLCPLILKYHVKRLELLRLGSISSVHYSYLQQSVVFVYMITYISDKSQETWKGYYYSILMLTVVCLQSIVLHQYFYHCTVVGMRLRTVVIGAVYEKMLKLSNTARKSSTVGEIVNLMSVDAQKFNDLMTFLNMIWSGPFQIIVGIYLLWMTLGPSILAGLGVMIVMIPLNGFMANQVKKLQVKAMSLKDQRIKMMSEILNGIKVLKLYAWEMSFEKKVLEIRNRELSVLKKISYLNACTSFTWIVAPVAVCLATFAVYVMIDDNNILDAHKAFVSLSLFNILRFPLSMLPQVISNIIQVRVSLSRLRTFLSHSELDETAVEHNSELKQAITFKTGDFGWDNKVTLKNINLEIPVGSLIAVVGSVGCGKSSFLSAILGEMNKIKGHVSVKGSIAYVAQQAWIQNASVQDNILFGKSMDIGMYQRLINACALQPDLDIMPAGDQTEIGEKGINLSGGQKQRVSLARALYQDRDTYLLDDPLSAVDAHVGKHIFENVIGPNGLLKGKTRVLVTHGVGYLPYVDTIVVLVNGQISEIGSYKQLLHLDGAFAQFLKNYLKEEMAKEHAEDIELNEDIISQMEKFAGDVLKRQVSVVSERIHALSESHSAMPPSTPDGTAKQFVTPNYTNNTKGSKTNLVTQSEHGQPDDGIKEGKKEEENKLIKVETMETENVKWTVYFAYVKSVGVLFSTLTVLLYIFFNAASVLSNIWLSQWSDDAKKYLEDRSNNSNITFDSGKRDLRLGIYGLLGFVQGGFLLVATLIWFIGNIKAGRFLHKSLLRNIIVSPMSFFDTVPVGRILNRFAKDIDAVDMVIGELMRIWVHCFLQVLMVPVVTAYSTPLILISFIPMAFINIFVQRFYVGTSRQLKRLESVSRSPVYSHFGETVTGVSTIRAYRQQERFIETSEKKVDHNLEVHYLTIIANRWLAIRLEFVGNFILFFACLFAVIYRGKITPGLVGLSITYAMNVTQILNWMVRMTTELEANIVAVERIKEYSETPTEAAWEIPEKCPAVTWPEKGIVEFDNYGTRYREGLDLVIKGITCTIHPAEKVGIVGRTGAGKSSLTLALFRIIEPAIGRIVIDGVDIAKIGLHDLRSKLTIIPQEPVLFSGTLRMNLDPFDEHSDDNLWLALEHAHLKTFVSSLPKALEHECSEGGENLSVGQRQLVCLARALLRKTKILILDEATAAVDLGTDDLIQKTIRTEFKDCTVLTIAHRLNTIMDYTRVMVLDQGLISEFNSPDVLLKNTNSIFYRLARDAKLV